jgi:hypothetical protein
LRKFRSSRAFGEYKNHVLGLYEAIEKVSGKEVIVDSSKNPVRAFALTQIKDIDLRLVHLVRDVRGVVCSVMKPHRKDPSKGVQKDLEPIPLWRAALMWRVINHLSEMALAES